MGTREQQQLPNSCTFLRVWRKTTHHVSNTTDRTKGFDIEFKDTPTMSHRKGFQSNLVRRAELFYLPVKVVNIPGNMKLEINKTDTTLTAYISPVTLTPTGMEVIRNRNDAWTFNTQGFLMRTHRTTRNALFCGRHQQTDLRTTGEQLCTGGMATMRTLRKHIKTSTHHNRKESYRDKHGQEKRGSEWREEHLFLATHHHNHHHCLPRQHKRQEQQRHQHQQSWRHHNPWQDTQPRSQLTTVLLKTHLHPQQLRFHIPRMFNEHQATGFEKDTCGNEYMSNQEGTGTYHNKLMMDQTWQDWHNTEHQPSVQQMEQEETH